MSPFLFDADLARTDLGVKARSSISIVEATSTAIADLFAEYADAVASGDFDRMVLIREHAARLDDGLVDELDGFDYPAAA